MNFPRAGGACGLPLGEAGVADRVRRDELLVAEDRTDLVVEPVELFRVPRRALHTAELLQRRVGLLELDQDRDRRVIGVRVRPTLDLLEAADQRRARGVVV